MLVNAWCMLVWAAGDEHNGDAVHQFERHLHLARQRQPVRPAGA